MDIKRPKLLLTIPRIPFPLNSGGRIAIYDTIKLLSQKHDLIIVIIDDNENNRQYLPHLQAFSSEIYFFSKSKIRFIVNALWGLVRGKPLQVGYFYFRDIQKLVDKLYLKCDLLVSFMIRTTTYGLNLPVKKMHYAIDSMYLNYRKSQENTKSLLWKIIYSIEIPLLFKAELKQIQKYNLTTFVNREEAIFWKTYGNVETLPHGVEKDVLDYTQTDSKYRNVVAFIGRMDYQPNIEAVNWFCANVLKYLHHDIEFWIIGGFPTTVISKLAATYNNVKVLGFVDDPYIILKSCICTVAPMQSGGGLQTKILVAMALNSVVLSSSLPIAAIENAKNGENILVEDEPTKFAETINQIYLNPEAYAKVKKAAKQLIEEKYALSVIENRLLKLVENIEQE